MLPQTFTNAEGGPIRQRSGPPNALRSSDGSTSIMAHPHAVASLSDDEVREIVALYMNGGDLIASAANRLECSGLIVRAELPRPSSLSADVPWLNDRRRLRGA